MPVPSTLCPFPQRGGEASAIPRRPPRSPRPALKQQSPSVSHGAEASPRHTGLPKIHADRRGNQYPFQTEHPLPRRRRRRHPRWGSALAAVRRRGCAPFLSPRNKHTDPAGSTPLPSLSLRCFMRWMLLAHWRAPRRYFSSQRAAEPRVAFAFCVCFRRSGRGFSLWLPSEYAQARRRGAKRQSEAEVIPRGGGKKKKASSAR